MSDSKGNGPSFSEIGLDAANTVMSVTADLIGSATDAAEKAADSVDLEALKADFEKAKAELVSTATSAGIALLGKAASHPLGRKAVSAIFAPKPSGRPEDGESPSSPGDNLINQAIVIGGDVVNWLKNRKAS